MPKGYYLQGYKNTGENEFGELVTVRWVRSQLDSTFDFPEEHEDGEPEVYIEGKEYWGWPESASKDLQELVEKLMAEGYEQDPDWQDGPDFD